MCHSCYVQQLTRFQLTCGVARSVCSSRAGKIWIIPCWYPSKVCIVKLFPKTDFICKHSKQFWRFESKSTVARIQLTCNQQQLHFLIIFYNLLYTTQICAIFVHLTIRAYRCMVGKANEKVSVSVSVSLSALLINFSITISISDKFETSMQDLRPISVLNTADTF